MNSLSCRYPIFILSIFEPFRKENALLHYYVISFSPYLLVRFDSKIDALVMTVNDMMLFYADMPLYDTALDSFVCARIYYILFLMLSIFSILFLGN